MIDKIPKTPIISFKVDIKELRSLVMHQALIPYGDNKEWAFIIEDGKIFTREGKFILGYDSKSEVFVANSLYYSNGEAEFVEDYDKTWFESFLEQQFDNLSYYNDGSINVTKILLG